MNDSNLAAHERNSALLTRFDMKNLDLKTDGTPISYKPEYHSSHVTSEVFPGGSPPRESISRSPQGKKQFQNYGLHNSVPSNPIA